MSIRFLWLNGHKVEDSINRKCSYTVLKVIKVLTGLCFNHWFSGIISFLVFFPLFRVPIFALLFSSYLFQCSKAAVQHLLFPPILQALSHSSEVVLSSLQYRHTYRSFRVILTLLTMGSSSYVLRKI